MTTAKSGNMPKHIARCLELAALGSRSVMPNPMVGAVLTHKDKVIGEGYHKEFGGPHAEVWAINSVSDKSLLPESTLYVSLEPCSHHGKTPPCTELILNSGIKHVVVGCRDPFPKVAGKGLEALEKAGIKVEVGVLADECIALNRRFMISHRQKRPYVILKWAETADGYVAREDYTSKWISCEESRFLSHKFRAEEMSILVGTTTAAVDDPQLTVRHVDGPNPIRIVIDLDLVLNEKLCLFDATATTWTVTSRTDHGVKDPIIITRTEPLVPQLLTSLYQRSIISLIVEGGARTIQSFLEADLWDEVRVFHGTPSFGGGIKAPRPNGTLVQEKKIDSDLLRVIQHPKLPARLGIMDKTKTVVVPQI